MRRRTAVLLVAGLPMAAPAVAMMPPWAYEKALAEAVFEAVLTDLDVRRDADVCLVSGMVGEVRARAGERSAHYPRRRKLTEAAQAPTGNVRPEPGTRLSLTLACFTPDTPPAPGGYFQFSYENLRQARKLVVPVNGQGAVVDAYGGGVYMID